MYISVFELFKIGIGPSSSHTVGPMRAAHRFIASLEENTLLQKVHSLTIRLHGSLAHTGKGHGTDSAILLGLEDHLPDTVDTDYLSKRATWIYTHHQINLYGTHQISFDPKKDLIYDRKTVLHLHSNGMHFQAFDHEKTLVFERTYFSIGGGL